MRSTPRRSFAAFSIDRVGDELNAGNDELATWAAERGPTKRIKIPNVCVGLHVKCVTPYEMLRRERARFGLG